jgi:hypothetical protein
MHMGVSEQLLALNVNMWNGGAQSQAEGQNREGLVS